MMLNNEKQETVYKFDVDLEDTERELLLEYAKDNISVERLEDFYIEWAIIDIIQKQVGEEDES